MSKLTEPYLTVVLLVYSGKNNIHCIRHDVNRRLVFLPVFSVGFLSTKGSCRFDILDVVVGNLIFSEEVLTSTLSMI